MDHFLKYFFVSTLLISLSINIIGQTPDEINKVDGNNKKQGLWIKYYPNGKVQYKGTFKDDMPIDTMTRYYQNSSIMSVTIYSVESNEVYSHIFDQNGFKVSEGSYKNQMKEGLWKFYSPTVKDYLVNEEYYSENIRNGISTKYFENKAVAEKINYSYGIKDGEWTQYYENGQLSLRSFYINGSLEGKFETWYPDGKPKYVGYYRDNYREGKWYMYNEDRSLKYEADYIRGTTNNSQMLLDASESIDKMEQQGKSVDDPEDGLPMFY